MPKAKDPLRDQFNKGLINRVKIARQNSGLSQEEMATALGIKQDRWKQYETRTPIPIYMVDQFAIIVREDPLYILLGRRPERRIPISAAPLKEAK